VEVLPLFVRVPFKLHILFLRICEELSTVS
jgi:hypothetical protein